MSATTVDRLQRAAGRLEQLLDRPALDKQKVDPTLQANPGLRGRSDRLDRALCSLEVIVDRLSTRLDRTGSAGDDA